MGTPHETCETKSNEASNPLRARLKKAENWTPLQHSCDHNNHSFHKMKKTYGKRLHKGITLYGMRPDAGVGAARPMAAHRAPERNIAKVAVPITRGLKLEAQYQKMWTVPSYYRHQKSSNPSNDEDTRGILQLQDMPDLFGWWRSYTRGP